MTGLAWHEPVKERLQAALARRRLPHALLITGYAGWGEVELAEWLALLLLDRQQGSPARQLAHPDFRWVAPDGDVIKVEQIRELGEFVHGTAQIADAKVAVIENAHAMNVNAGNALLKTLEEPPGTTYLILASDRPGRLSATVRSRCQRFDIVPNQSLARAWLDSAAARELLADYGGGPLAAASAEAAGERPMRDILTELTRGRQAAVLDELLGQDPGRMSGRWARCLVRCLAGDMELAGVSFSDRRAMFQFVDELWWFHGEVTRSNSANVRLLLERLTTRWCSLTLARPGRA